MGVKYALLWGFLAAMLRYLPYIGPYLAAVFPISLSLAMFDGWGTTLMVAGLFLTLELIVANAVEPWLYGQSMGVSEIALLVSAAFWAFLWGPVGLVLSSPLTVCLVMLGRYVPQLEFLAVLLGDEPALDPSVSFYQRLLARDQDEAEDLILEHLKTESEEGVYDEMLIPTLRATKLSRGRGDITEADEQYVLQAIREIVEDLGDRPESDESTAREEADGQSRRAIAKQRRRSGSSAARPTTWRIEPPWRCSRTCSTRSAGNWRCSLPKPSRPSCSSKWPRNDRPCVCLAATPPGGLAHTRYLCKRLRARFPDLKILVCRWDHTASTQSNPGHCSRPARLRHDDTSGNTPAARQLAAGPGSHADARRGHSRPQHSRRGDVRRDRKRRAGPPRE